MINKTTKIWKKIGRPSLATTIAVTVLAIGLTASLWVITLNGPTGTRPKTVRIEPGMSVASISRRLGRERIIQSPRFLRALAIVTGASRSFTAGDHPFDGSMTTWEVLRELRVPRDVTQSVTIPEGLRRERVIEILVSSLDLDREELDRMTTDSAFCRKVGVNADNLEGYLFPETYRVSVSAGEEQVLRVLIDHFHKIVDDDLKRSAALLDMTVHEVVTMASIIEGEAVIDSERDTISAVYHNRLKRRMRLQADPTVQYAIPDGPRRLFYKDYQFDSPYNTYRHSGLPPGPILSPGAASLRAAVNPARIDYLYFVAKGDGSHVFTKTAREHEAAKRQTKSARRQTWRQSSKRR